MSNITSTLDMRQQYRPPTDSWMGLTGVSAVRGQAEYNVPGVYNFVVPATVYSICAVAVGAGGGGGYTWANYAGTGGGLAYANDIPVVPGQTISITVPGWTAVGTNGGSAIVGGFFSATGGNYSAGVNGNNGGKPTAGTVTPYGSNGGIANTNMPYICGGGGAGGYIGQGGMGGSYPSNVSTGSNSGGGGGVGYSSSTFGFGGGGGVGIYGNPTAALDKFGASVGNAFYTSTITGGSGGSGGMPGAGNSNTSETLSGPNIAPTLIYHGCGGLYGGGGGAGGTSVAVNALFCRGAPGAVRIIWGTGRSFPYNAL